MAVADSHGGYDEPQSDLADVARVAFERQQMGALRAFPFVKQREAEE